MKTTTACITAGTLATIVLTGCASSLRVIAHGEDSSVTGKGCKGKRGDDLKGCHKPDRRVTVAVGFENSSNPLKNAPIP